MKKSYSKALDKERVLISELFSNDIENRIRGLCLGRTHRLLGFYEAKYNKNLKNSILRYYEATKLMICKNTRLSFVGIYNHNAYDNLLVNGIFSNAPMLINDLQSDHLLPPRVDYDEEEDKPISEYPIHHGLDKIHWWSSALQALLAPNYDQLKESIEGLSFYKNSKKSKWVEYDEKNVELFQAFYDHNESEINVLLEERLLKEKKWGTIEWHGYSFIVTGLAKLAVMNGYEIKIESPYIVKELLDTSPLESYETYDWLEVLYYEGYDAYLEKFVKTHQKKNEGGFFNKLFGKN